VSRVEASICPLRSAVWACIGYRDKQYYIVPVSVAMKVLLCAFLLADKSLVNVYAKQQNDGLLFKLINSRDASTDMGFSSAWPSVDVEAG